MEITEHKPVEIIPITPKQVLFMITVATTALMNGFMYGWGSVLPKIQQDTTTFTIETEDVAWLVSLVSLLAVVAAVSSGLLVEVLGPRRLLTLNLVPNMVFWVVMAVAPYKWFLYLGRAGSAFCTCLNDAIIQPLAAELSSTRMRGAAGSLPEVAAAGGMLTVYVLAQTASWRLATGLCALLILPIIILLLFVPESPYWYVRRGQREAAERSLYQLYGSQRLVEQELFNITASPNATQASLKDQFVALQEFQNFKPVLLTLCLFVVRELGGRSAVFAYSVYIFQGSGVQINAFTCTVMVGIMRFVTTCISVSLIDRVGRRPLLVSTAFVCGLAQGLSGLFLHMEVPGASWVPMAGILLYVAAYGIGVGPIPWVLTGELLPTPVRSVGVSIIHFCFTITLFGINYIFLRVINRLGLGMTLIVFGIFNFVFAAIVWIWLPETRGISLQELEQAFSRSKVSKRTAEKQTRLEINT